MPKSEKLDIKQVSRLERQKLDVLEQLFASLKQGLSQYDELIGDFERSVRRNSNISPASSEEYSEAIAHWLGGWGSLYRGWENSSDKAFAKKIQIDWTRMKGRLSGSVLVDLGCGHQVAGFMYEAVSGEKYPVSAFVGVDRYAWAETAYNPTVNLFPKEENLRHVKTGRPPIGQVHSDMLDFVARLPDDSVNFVLNGIDRYILGGSGKYHKTLTKEIIRSTKRGGIIFGADFSAISGELASSAEKTAELRRMCFPSYMRRDLDAFEKI